jgi:hypothetical protein
MAADSTVQCRHGTPLPRCSAFGQTTYGAQVSYVAHGQQVATQEALEWGPGLRSGKQGYCSKSPGSKSPGDLVCPSIVVCLLCACPGCPQLGETRKDYRKLMRPGSCFSPFALVPHNHQTLSRCRTGCLCYFTLVIANLLEAPNLKLS